MKFSSPPTTACSTSSLITARGIGRRYAFRGRHYSIGVRTAQVLFRGLKSVARIFVKLLARKSSGFARILLFFCPNMAIWPEYGASYLYIDGDEPTNMEMDSLKMKLKKRKGKKEERKKERKKEKKERQR